MSLDPRDIELSAEQAHELSKLAEEVGKPWPVVFREAMDSYRHQASDGNGRPPGESFLEAASNAGLVGCLTGGPVDLSSNPAYMQGFGEDHG